MTDRSSTADGDHSHARADFWTGLLLIVLGLAAFVASLDMPRFEERDINPYTIPGLVPGAIALVITLLGAALTLRGVRQRARSGLAEEGRVASEGNRRLRITLLLTLTYAALLVGRLPFWLATGLFVFAFVALFEWRADRSSREKARALGVALFYAAVVSAVVTYVFQEIFLVRLP